MRLLWWTVVAVRSNKSYTSWLRYTHKIHSHQIFANKLSRWIKNMSQWIQLVKPKQCINCIRLNTCYRICFSKLRQNKSNNEAVWKSDLSHLKSFSGERLNHSVYHTILPFSCSYILYWLSYRPFNMDECSWSQLSRG